MKAISDISAIFDDLQKLHFIGERREGDSCRGFSRGYIGRAEDHLEYALVELRVIRDGVDERLAMKPTISRVTRRSDGSLRAWAEGRGYFVWTKANGVIRSAHFCGVCAKGIPDGSVIYRGDAPKDWNGLERVICQICAESDSFAKNNPLNI